MSNNIIVVGSGIIGASAAYQLQKRGAAVTVIDAGRPSATKASFGWINASFFENKDHFHLRTDAISTYRHIMDELSLPVSWCGCLCWETKGSELDAQRDALSDLGYPVEEIDSEQFSRLEPHVANPPERCLFFQQEAAAESGELADQLLKAAVDLGARVINGINVQGFIRKGKRIIGVRTDVGELTADQVVVAAGTATQGLMAGLDVHLPMLKRPALILTTRPVDPILSHVLVSEIGEVRQLPNGSLLMPAVIGHQGDTTEALTTPPQQVADKALARLQSLVPDVPLDWGNATVAHRPVPQDGLPVVGFAKEGLYVATMHSGITLGALIGQQIATELLDGPTNETAQRLAPFRPERFAV